MDLCLQEIFGEMRSGLGYCCSLLVLCIIRNRTRQRQRINVAQPPAWTFYRLRASLERSIPTTGGLHDSISQCPTLTCRLRSYANFCEQRRLGAIRQKRLSTAGRSGG